MIAPRRGVSCRRGAGQGGDCEPDCGAAPVSRGRTSGRHGELDAADADAHERADLEQLEPDGAAGGLGEVGIVEPDTTVSAEPLPQPKTGQCPAGYRQSGGYCMPMSPDAPAAIPKLGQCPSG